jgi:HK97 family phage major capsid protein
MKPVFPRIRMDAKPAGLKFKPPASALARFDKSIRSEKKSDGEIEILGEIGESGWSSEFTTAKMVKDQLKAIGKAPVLVTVNSPGGDAFEGIAIYNLLREHQGKITVHVLGLAASAASIVAMAGDTIKVGEGAFLMIHSSHGIVVGNQGDMREFADLLDSIDKSVASLYAVRSGKSEADVLEMMRKETWLSGAEAVKAGFADVAVADDKKKAKAATEQAISASTHPALLAASGDRQRPVVRLSVHSPGASGKPKEVIPKDMKMGTKTIAEQISAFEQKRAASVARMQDIMDKSAETGSTLDEAQTQEYDALDGEVKAVDEHLVRLKKHEAQMVSKAKEIKKVDDPESGSAARGVTNIISVRPNVEKGVAFARYVMALGRTRGNVSEAHAYASNNKQWMDTTPEVAKVLMAAVAGGDTTTAGWAAEWVYAQNLVNEFIEILRPMTIIGRIPGLTRVPFNVRVAGASSGTSAFWVGQGRPVPVSKMVSTATTLGIAKAAGLVVLTEELVRSSSPSAELMVRNDLTGSITQFLDQQFIDPNFAPVTNVSPGSITYGVAGIVPTGTTSATLRADVQTLFGSWITANLDPSKGVWVMPASTALSISLMLNALGQPVFPDITMNGGTFFGLPVVTSQTASVTTSPETGALIVLINAPEIMLADDGGIAIDASREASIEQLDNPTNSAAAGTNTTMVSMFQTSSVAIKAVRFINWAKRRTTAVRFIQQAAYVT